MQKGDDGSKEPLLPPAQQFEDDAVQSNPQQIDENAGEQKQATRSRQSLWNTIKPFLSLRTLFNRFGRCVGKYPRWFLLLSMLLSLCTYGMFKLILRDDVREGYTAYDARSRYEAQVARNFYGAIDDPMLASLLMLAKDGGTMHRKEYLDEAYEIVKSVQNITMKYGEHRLIYREMCKPHCFGDEVFGAFKRGFDVAYGAATGLSLHVPFLNLSYPFGSIMGIRVPFDKCLYGVRLADSNSSENSTFFFGLLSYINPNQTIESQITNMEHVTLIAITLYGNKDTFKKSTDFSLWELAAYDYSHQYNQNFYKNETLVEFLVFGSEILNMEINKANTKLSPYFGAGMWFMGHSLFGFSFSF